MRPKPGGCWHNHHHQAGLMGRFGQTWTGGTMPVLIRPDGEIHYQTFGEGSPVLLFAPGGLRSRMTMWPAPPGGPARPWVDWTSSLPTAGFMTIAMDQRNAGQS